MQWYAPSQGRFLPDRYVEGTCYICGYTNARSDQCDNCGNLLDATQLIDPRSQDRRLDPRAARDRALLPGPGQAAAGDRRLPARARESYWRPNVLRQSLGQIQAEGLHGRAITRDLDWGIPVPVEGWDGKCLYVWFEAVIGYLSAAIEWAQINGEPGSLARTGGTNPEARAYYFIGKDNIPFHAVIWPAQLIGAGECVRRADRGSRRDAPLTLPYDVPANEFMNLEGQKISGSRNWAVWGLRFPHPLRPRPAALLPDRQYARKPRTPIGIGTISSTATTTSWWPPGATWPTGCCPLPTSTGKGACPSRAS